MTPQISPILVAKTTRRMTSIKNMAFQHLQSVKICPMIMTTGMHAFLTVIGLLVFDNTCIDKYSQPQNVKSRICTPPHHYTRTTLQNPRRAPSLSDHATARQACSKVS